MEQYTDYLLKVSFGLAVEYVFYRIFLARLTYYQWNRAYLILYSTLAFIIPLVDLGPAVKDAQWPVQAVAKAASVVPYVRSVVSDRNVIDISTAESITAVDPGAWTFGFYDLLSWLYLAGVLVFILRLLMGLIAVARLKRRSVKIEDGGLALYVSKTKIAPFAFGKSVFFDERDYASASKEAILMHEEVHVKQWHSLDTLFAELLVAFNWYNPFAWLIRRTIRQNLEFIADQELLSRGIDAQKYQYMLLELAGYTPYFFGNQFTFSSLKERITMMNRLRSGRIQLAKFLVLVPVVAISLTMCQKGEVDNTKSSGSSSRMIVMSEHNPDIFAGIILDAQTLKPVDKFRMMLVKYEVIYSDKSVKGKLVRAIGQKVDSIYIEADSDGFYYWKNPDLSEKYHYIIEDDDPRYQPFRAGNGGANISFIQPISGIGPFDNYFISWNSDPSTESAHQIKDYLSAVLADCSSRYKLISDFKKTRFHSGKLITHFRNAYFDGKDNLLGFEGNIDFYLDGEKTTYDLLNSTFEWQAPAIIKPVGYLNRPLTNQHTEFSCYTSPLSRDVAPPKALATPAHFEWISGFDISRLNSEPYYLDGFRQIKGIGSNLKPEIGDIKRVALLKGKLARYYSSNLDKILWIETRPKNEIPGRPEF